MKAIYNQSTHSLEEQPEMGYPNDSNSNYRLLWGEENGEELAEEYERQYKEHIASRKEYPVAGEVKWVDGQILEEGKDWKKVNVCEDGQRCECNNSEAERCLYSKFIAIPIEENKKVEEEKEDEIKKQLRIAIEKFMPKSVIATDFMIEEIIEIALKNTIVECFSEWVCIFYVALSELIELKDIKDTEGKTDEYLERQPKAWHVAKESIELWQKHNYGAIPLKNNLVECKEKEDQDEAEYNRGYGDGYRDATNEAREEIKEHYHPNS